MDAENSLLWRNSPLTRNSMFWQGYLELVVIICNDGSWDLVNNNGAIKQD